MTSVTLQAGSTLATGINVFALPPDRQPALIDTLHAVNHEIRTLKFPMNVSASFHRGIDASIVINYNQYTDRESGGYLRTRPETAPLLKRTHDLSDKHEIRWYQVADVVAAGGAGDRIDISEGAHTAVIGLFTVEPAKQGDLLALLRRYGETLAGAGTDGFIGIAIHRGYQGEHVAAYEQWASADAYRRATRQESVTQALTQIGATVSTSDLHLYDVLSVNRFNPGA